MAFLHRGPKTHNKLLLLRYYFDRFEMWFLRKKFSTRTLRFQFIYLHKSSLSNINIKRKTIGPFLLQTIVFISASGRIIGKERSADAVSVDALRDALPLEAHLPRKQQPATQREKPDGRIRHTPTHTHTIMLL